MTFVICLSCLTAKIVLGFPTSFFYRAKFSKHDQNELFDKAVAGSFSKQEKDFAGSHITNCWIQIRFGIKLFAKLMTYK